MSPSHAQQPKDSETDFLRHLVSQSSGTPEIEGVRKVEQVVAEELKKIGFTIEEFSADNPEIKSKQFVATRKGRENKFVTFVTHADTVFDNSNQFAVSADQTRITGPGVGDDKGGLTVALFALRQFLEKNPNLRYSLRFVISPSEETGSVGFRNRLRQFSEDSALILGMEPALADGSIIKARKGVQWYQIEVTGKEAHAGVNPEEGVNACHQLAKSVDQIVALNDYKSGNTLNVGHFEGGKDKFNIVCGHAEAKIDFRFVDNKSKDLIQKKIENILKKDLIHSKNSKEVAKIEEKIITEVPPFAISPASQKMIEQYLKIIRKIEQRPVSAVLTGGAADLNYMSAGSALMLDGLGPVGGGYHTKDEYIELSSLESRTEALVQLLIHFEADTAN